MKSQTRVKEKKRGKRIGQKNCCAGFRALTLAMGVAVVALSCLGSLETGTGITLLGIGLASAGAAMLEKRVIQGGKVYG